ncbi:MAG: hypothetical protein WAQ99_21280 [Pyrinomonadaceae bacterium]
MDEIEIDESTFSMLAAIVDADENAQSLASLADVDPEEFRKFLSESGETENEDALELLAAAWKSRIPKHVPYLVESKVREGTKTIPHQMQEICTKAEELANGILQGAGFDLRASAAESEQGCLLSIDGTDNGLLLNQGGELLDALQQILNQAFGRDLPKGQRIVCDADNYRATREGELKAMARHAARQVRSTSLFAIGDRVDQMCITCGEERGHIVASITKTGKITRVSCPICGSRVPYRSVTTRRLPSKVGTPYDRARTYRRGQTLMHPTFGEGEVTAVESEKIYVLFSDRVRRLIHSTPTFEPE